MFEPIGALLGGEERREGLDDALVEFFAGVRPLSALDAAPALADFLGFLTDEEPS